MSSHRIKREQNVLESINSCHNMKHPRMLVILSVAESCGTKHHNNETEEEEVLRKD